MVFKRINFFWRPPSSAEINKIEIKFPPQSCETKAKWNTKQILLSFIF